MGNSQTKEVRQQESAPSSRLGTQSYTSSVPDSRTERDADQMSSDRPPLPSYNSSGRRGSRPDLSFLGIGSNERDVSAVEVRRETKQEREARKLEKERAARLKERERSMKEEHVDGGYLVTQGVYVGTEDYNKVIVRQLMVGCTLLRPIALEINSLRRLSGNLHHSGEVLTNSLNPGLSISSWLLLVEWPYHLRTRSLQSLNIKGNQVRPPTFDHRTNPPRTSPYR